MIEEGSLVLPVVTALLLVGGWFLEVQLLARFRADWYFLAGLPLWMRPVPIPTAPEGAGRTHSVCWEVSGADLVRYWADPNTRTAPSGLHGVVVLTRTRNGVELDVRWAPPWTPIIAAAWLAGLGVVRGEAQLTVPVALCMVAGLFLVYGTRARRVAAELRWSFVRGEPPEDDPG